MDCFALLDRFHLGRLFSPIAHQLIDELLARDLGGWETFWIFFYAFATYGNGRLTCASRCANTMCPYARFQSAMFDADTLIITLRPAAA